MDWTDHMRAIVDYIDTLDVDERLKTFAVNKLTEATLAVKLLEHEQHVKQQSRLN